MGDSDRDFARFLSWVDLSVDGCWLWIGAVNNKGYGSTSVSNRSVMAHRWSYELFVGPIPDGLHIDHLCRIRNCVRPDHLEPVTLAENNRRSSMKTSCKYGHPFDDANTYVGTTYRDCRACGRVRAAAYKARKRAAR